MGFDSLETIFKEISIKNMAINFINKHIDLLPCSRYFGNHKMRDKLLMGHWDASFPKFFFFTPLNIDGKFMASR